MTEWFRTGTVPYMQTTQNPTRLPWHLRVIGGGFHSGYNEKIDAENARQQVDKQAEALGIQARYEVVAKPDAA